MARWQEITLVVEGAEDSRWTSLDHFGGEDSSMTADEKAVAVAGEMDGSEFASWEVFITPHSCDPATDDCICVAWLDDHHPAFSGGRADPQ